MGRLKSAFFYIFGHFFYRDWGISLANPIQQICLLLKYLQYFLFYITSGRRKNLPFLLFQKENQYRVTKTIENNT
jgi:hypothetical protein